MKDINKIKSRLLNYISAMPRYFIICLLYITVIDPAYALGLNDVLTKTPANEIFPDADRVEQDSEKPAIAKV
ncbi:MAG: hypothetical protein KAJ03_02255, partial [Gammaproteobacteria bacterium]|nr:hypothetical protein [Gammaproteobacteria bacterium]